MFNYLHRLDLFIYFLSFFVVLHWTTITTNFLILFFSLDKPSARWHSCLLPSFHLLELFLCFCPLQCCCASSENLGIIYLHLPFPGILLLLFIYLLPWMFSQSKSTCCHGNEVLFWFVRLHLSLSIWYKESKKEEVLWELHGVRPPQTPSLSSLKHNPRARRRRLHLLFPIFSTRPCFCLETDTIVLIGSSRLLLP